MVAFFLSLRYKMEITKEEKEILSGEQEKLNRKLWKYW